MVKPLVDAQGQVVANARSNTLVLVDYASNMPRLREIVSGLDADDRTKVETVELRNVPAREIEGILSNLLSDRDDNPSNRFEVSASTSSQLDRPARRGGNGSACRSGGARARQV